MDSASGSMQSSSGGDEEYDSRVADSISYFLNQTTTNSHSPLSLHHVTAPMAPPQQNLHSTMFEPLSSFFDPLSASASSSSPSSRSIPSLSNPNSLLNLDLVWSKNLRSEPNCTDLGGFVSASTLNQPQNRPTMTCGQIPLPGTSNQLSATGQAEQVTVNQHSNSQSNPVGRNPKKRSRASRRAPTTVLTTDTSNFRAMVQEFTGIPAPPFTSSPFPRTRLDLYGNSSPGTLRSAHLEAAPPHHPSYLLRPFAQKIEASTSSFLGSSSIDAIVSATTTAYTTNINTSTTRVSNSSTSINYLQLPQNLLNISMQNPPLNFQPLLPPKYPLPDSQIPGCAAAGKSPQPPQQQQVSLENIPPGDSRLKVSNSLEDFGSGHGLQSVVPQQDLNESDGDHQQQQVVFWSNGKEVNFSASSTSGFREDKLQQNVVKARSEGMMESWICSSD